MECVGSGVLRARVLVGLLVLVCLAAGAEASAVVSPERLRSDIRRQPSKGVMLHADVAAALREGPVLAQPQSPSPDRGGMAPEPPGGLAVDQGGVVADAPSAGPASEPTEGAGTAPEVAEPPVPVKSVAARVVQLSPELWRAARAQIQQQLVVSSESGTAAAFTPAAQALIAPADDDEEVTLVPIAMVDRPLSYVRDRGAYVGRIAVGLVAIGYSGPSKVLKAPITFQVLGVDAAAPEQQVVPNTSPPYPPMEVVANDPRETVAVRIFSNISADPIQLEIPVLRSRLQLSAADQSLQGWGLESAVITVASSDGARSAGQLVTLSKSDPAARGVIEPESQTLDATGQARFKLTSEATGEVMVRASGPQLLSAEPQRFIMDPPLRFIGAAVFGGLVGGALRRGIKSGGKASYIAMEFVLAVLAGALVFGLFVLGVNVTGFSLPTRGGEVLVAVVAAVGGLFGTKLVGRE